MIKIAHGYPGEEILTRAETFIEGIAKVKEFRIGEFEEDIRESRLAMLEIREQMELGGVTDNLISEYNDLKEAIEESEELIAEIEKCKNYTQLDALTIYDENWYVNIVP